MEKKERTFVEITQENQKLFFHCIPDTYKSRLFRKGMTAIGAVMADGRGCGAVVACQEEGGIRILSVYVEPEYRREGIGSELLKKLQRALEQAGKTEQRLFIEYPYPKMRELELVLFRNGFSVESEANQIYSVPVLCLKELELLKKQVSMTEGSIIPVKKMTEEQRIRWLHRFGKNFPAELSPQNAGGVLLGEESFVYMQNGQVDAFAVCSRLEDDSVYLAALYGEKRGIRGMVSLLQKTLGALLDKYQDKMLCFSAATDAGKKLAENLCKGHEDKIEIQTMRTSVWMWEDRSEPVEYNSYAWINLKPRLNGLEVILNDLGIDTYKISVNRETYPELLADIEGETLRFSYIPVGPLEQERFILNLTAVLPDRQGGTIDQMALCQIFNLGNHFATAIFDIDQGQVMLRHMLPEFGKIITAETLNMAVRQFMDSIRQFELQER